MFNDNVTIYHIKNGIVSTTLHFKQVYFKSSKIISESGNGVSNANTGIIRIQTTKALDIAPGDYVVKGIITDSFNLKTFMQKYDLFKITSVTNNLRGGLQHYKLEVQG